MGSFHQTFVNMRSKIVFLTLAISFCAVNAIDKSKFASSEIIPDQKVCQGLKHRQKGGHKLSPNQQHLMELCEMQAEHQLDKKTVVNRCEKLVHKTYNDLGRYQKKKYEACIVFLDFER